MSKRLAEKLLRAGSVKGFLRDHRRPLGWQEFSALKTQVDRLVHTDLNIAARLVERLEQLAALTRDDISAAFAQASRARLLHLFGRHAQANLFYERAIDVLRRARLKKEAARIQKQQVDTLAESGRYADALRVAGAARRVLQADAPIELAQLETNVGNIYYRLDRYRKALAHYHQARDIFTRSGAASMRALVALNISNICVEMDKPDEAVALLETAARTWSRVGQKLRAAQARSKIAFIYFLRGNYTAALSRYAQVREQLAAVGSTELVIWCELESAEVLLALNAFDDAAERAALAHSGFAELELPYEAAQAQVVWALALLGAGRFEPARERLETARAVFAASRNLTVVAQLDLYLAELAIKQGKPADAAPRARNSLRVFTRQRLPLRAAYARLLLARAALQENDYATAKRLAQRALVAVENHFAPTIAYQCHHLLGVVARANRQLNSRSVAREHFLRAVQIIEQLRATVAADEFKTSFLRDKIEVYEDAIGSCLDGGDDYLEQAFRLVEASKSRALAELLARYVRGAERQEKRLGKTVSENRARLLKLMEKLNWYSAQSHREEERGGQRRAQVISRYEREMTGCERQIAQLFRQLETTDAAFVEAQQLPPVSLAALSQTLAADETLLEYFASGDQLSVFVASPKQTRLLRAIASRREVEGALAALRFQLEKFNYGASFADEHFEQLHLAINQRLIELYDRLFAALEPHLQTRKLVIIPHGALHYLPFHALLNYRGYLVDRFEISYAPSATVFTLCRRRAGMMQRAANPKSKTQNPKSKIEMVALGLADKETPSIKAEIRALESLFPGCVSLTGRAATRDNLMKVAPAARFLHLASHSYFRRDNPMFSFLKLADAPLNFYSLMDWRLQAELVTLSACHTGMSRVFAGDELHGLMRGFLYAGAPSLVASLWAANDGSTAEFMREMYRRLRAGESKREALRGAQLAVKDAYGHPYYWAPFVLMGNPQ